MDRFKLMYFVCLLKILQMFNFGYVEHIIYA